MRFYRHNTRLFLVMLSLISIVFPMHLMITPLAYAKQADFETGSFGTKHERSEEYPLDQKVGSSYIVNLTVSEVLTDVMFNTIVNKTVRENNRMVNRITDSLVLPFLSIGIIFLVILYSRIKINRKKHVLAYSMGGHAPPVLA